MAETGGVAGVRVWNRRRSPSFGMVVAGRPDWQIGSVGSRRPGNGMSPAVTIERCSLGDRYGRQVGSAGDKTGCGSDPARGAGSRQGFRAASRGGQSTGMLDVSARGASGRAAGSGQAAGAGYGAESGEGQTFAPDVPNGSAEAG